MKVLIIGATGSLGSRVPPALLAHKHEVVAFVRSEGKLREMLPPSILSAITIVTGDAENSANITDALVDNKCDALINCAGLAAPLPWQATKLQGVINAVAAAGVQASNKLGHPLRAWFLGGMTALDLPGLDGTVIAKYFPLFKEHMLSYACLSSKPLDHLAWSLLCPSAMSPINPHSKMIAFPEGIQSNPLVASADTPPEWIHTWVFGIPFLGPLIDIFRNAMRYNIKLEDCADFMAADLERSNTEFIGHKVGIRESEKRKTE